MNGEPERLFVGSDDLIYVTHSPKGRGGKASVVKLGSSGAIIGEFARPVSNRGGFFTTDPSGEHLLFGSDRNTHTGREPWRQPYFYFYESDSIGHQRPQKALQLYGWKPNEQIRGDGKDGAYKLESDSSIVDAAYGSNGELFVVAWSDGGNSVMTRQPDSLEEKWPNAKLGISIWGMRGATGVSWLLKMDPGSKKISTATPWVAFTPKGFDNGPGNFPNTAKIYQVKVLENGSPVITGPAATGLAPTPNAFWTRPEAMTGRYSGLYVTVFTPGLDHVLFSSYLPGYQNVRAIPINEGLLIVGTTTENDGIEEVLADPPATENAPQAKFGGGQTDGHLVLLKLP